MNGNTCVQSAPAEPRLYVYPEEDQARPMRLALVTPDWVPSWVSDFAAMARRSRRVELRWICDRSLAAAQRRSEPPTDVRFFLALERTLLRLVMSLLAKGTRGPLTPLRVIDAGPDIVLPPSGEQRTVLDLVHEAAPDLVLLCGDERWAAPFAEVATHGCWVLGADLLDERDAGLALLEPMLEGNAVSRVGLDLVSHPEQRDSVALGETFRATKFMSFAQQRDLAFGRIPALLLRAIRRMRRQDAGVPAGVHELRFSPAPAAIASGTGLHAFVLGMMQPFRRRGRRARAQEPWFIMVRTGRSLDPVEPDAGDFQCLVAPGKDYWADPYPVVVDGRRLLFVEEYVDALAKGVIVCLELHPEGGFTRLGIVLEDPTHLSYPQVFRHDGEWFMTVESSEARRVSLYRSLGFPMHWQRVTDIVTGHELVDPTLHLHGGMWYLFGNVAEGGGSLSEELFLFVSEKLEGPYRAHPGNPIISDVRNSRPAGRLFHRDGRLIRPAQRCTPVYGAALVFNEVSVLTPERYAERQLAVLWPDMLPDLDGCHTYNESDEFEVLDAHGKAPRQDNICIPEKWAARDSGH